jgi:hypothetical protein
MININPADCWVYIYNSSKTQIDDELGKKEEDKSDRKKIKIFVCDGSTLAEQGLQRE